MSEIIMGALFAKPKKPEKPPAQTKVTEVLPDAKKKNTAMDRQMRFSTNSTRLKERSAGGYSKLA